MSALRSIKTAIERALSVQIVRIPRGWWPTREQRPLDPINVEVLADPRFRAALEDALPYSALDTPRLANLWQLALQAGPGIMVEAGTYKGGGAVVMARARPGMRLIVADTFAGFGEKHSGRPEDAGFASDEFRDTSEKAVRDLLSRHATDFTMLVGYFPASDTLGEVQNVSFAHVDLDLYESTIESLTYLAARATPGAMFVLDDYKRGAKGVDRAVSEFVQQNPGWRAFPLYPGQGLLVRSSAR